MEDIARNMPSALDHVAADREERESAIALLEAAIATAKPSLRLAVRLAPDREIVLGGPGECHERKAQYATTGRVSGWAWILLASGEIVRREYSGSHSDFPDYHRVRRSDTSATAAQVVDRSAYVSTYAARGKDAVRAIAGAVERVADERAIAAARELAESLRAALAAMSR